MAETPSLDPLEIVDSGRQAQALRQSNWIDARALAAGVAETFQAPDGARFVLFSSNGDFYCKIAAASTAAAVPAADVTDGSASELNPAMRYVGNQDYISLIAPTGGATIVTISYFKG